LNEPFNQLMALQESELMPHSEFYPIQDLYFEVFYLAET